MPGSNGSKTLYSVPVSRILTAAWNLHFLFVPSAKFGTLRPGNSDSR
jgi:hypothetical protein